MGARRAAGFHLTRDLILFAVGVAGIVYETVYEHADRPYLLAVFAACVGLPTYLATVAHQEEQ